MANKVVVGYGNMKKLAISFLIVLFSLSAVPVYAEYSSKAYGGNSGETFFNRTSDWFATLGKSQEENIVLSMKVGWIYFMDYYRMQLNMDV